MGSEIVICLRQMRSFRTPDKQCLSLQAACSLLPRRSGVPVAIDDRRYRAGLFPVPCSLVGAGCPWRSMIAATERVCSLFPVP